MKKWIKIILLILLFILIIVGIYNYWRLVYNIQFHGDELNQAQSSISNGFIIEDAKDDFAMLGSNKEELNAEDNPSPYRMDMIDFKSMQISSDENYLYYKISFYDTISKKPPVIDGDTLNSMGTVIDIFDASGKPLAVLHADCGWQPIVHIPAINTYYSTGPTGIEWPESARYKYENRDSKISGGVNTDYLLAAFPLKGLGLKVGDKISTDLSMEVKSAKFTHAAVDVLAGSGKTPGMITWQIGSKEYSIDNNVGNKNNKIN